MISPGEKERVFERDSEEARVHGRIALTLSNTAQTCLHIGDLKQCMKERHRCWPGPWTKPTSCSTQWTLFLGSQIANETSEQHWHERVPISRWCPFPFGLELAACCEDILAVQVSFISSVSSLVDFNTNQTKAIQVKQLNVHLISGNSCWRSHSVILSAVIFVL